MGFLLGAGLAAGLIDSIVGGGGLISVPALMLRLGVTPSAVGTNKIAGALCTLAALSVYGFHGRIPWATALRFAVWVGAGSVLGAAVGPRYFAPFYPFLLGAGTVLCLATLLLKDRLIAALKHRVHAAHGLSPLACGLGLACGFYDGAWGPGGGTFMFLALLYATPAGLVGSMAAAKIANFASASFALATYSWQGLVYWKLGGLFGLSLAAGALIGATLALRHAERLLTPALLAIVGLLLWKLLG